MVLGANDYSWCGSGPLFLAVRNTEHLGAVLNAREEASSPVSPQAEGGSGHNWRQGLVVTQQPPRLPPITSEGIREKAQGHSGSSTHQGLTLLQPASNLVAKSAFFHSNEILF